MHRIRYRKGSIEPSDFLYVKRPSTLAEEKCHRNLQINRRNAQTIDRYSSCWLCCVGLMQPTRFHPQL